MSCQQSSQVSGMNPIHVPVVFEAHVLDELDVLSVLVVAVAGHLGVGALRDLTGPLRPSVPDTGRPAPLVVPALDLQDLINFHVWDATK